MRITADSAVAQVHIENHSARRGQIPKYLVRCRSSKPTHTTLSPPEVFGQDNGTLHDAHNTGQAEESPAIEGAHGVHVQVSANPEDGLALACALLTSAVRDNVDSMIANLSRMFDV